jgi:hypothetical protein
VDYSVIGGTARGDGKDYTLKQGALTFNPGETVKAIEVEIKQSTLYDDDKTVEVSLAKPVNAVLGDFRVHTYTIVTTAPLPTVSFSAPYQNVKEDAGTISVTAKLSAISGKDVTVPFTADGTATGGTNYKIITPSPLIFKTGATAAEVRVELINNKINEEDKTLVLTLGQPANAALGPNPVHTLTIADIDPAPVVSFALKGSRGMAGASPAKLEVSLSAKSG